jgi:hypothetical protein
MRVRNQDFRKITDTFRGFYGMFFNFKQGKPKDVNIQLVGGLGHTEISTDYAQKSPQTLV